MSKMMHSINLPECATALYSFLPLEIGYSDMAATEDVTKPVAYFRGGTVDSWYHIKSILQVKHNQS